MVTLSEPLIIQSSYFSLFQKGFVNELECFMQAMRYIQQVSEVDHLQTFIHNEIKKYGIKIPKKKTRTRNDSQEVSDNLELYYSLFCLMPKH